MSEPIGDLTDRMRDIFRLVVEAYLDRGQPVGSKTLAGCGQPVAGLDPRRDAGSGGARAAHPSAHLGRADPDRDRPAAVRRRDHARRAAAGAASARRSRRRSNATGRSRRRSPRPPRRLSGLSACAGVVLAPKTRAAPEAAQLRAAGARTARWRCWSAADGSVENRVVDLPPGDQRGRARRGRQLRQRAPLRPDAGRSGGAAARRDQRAARSARLRPPPSWSRAASPTGARTMRSARC